MCYVAIQKSFIKKNITFFFLNQSFDMKFMFSISLCVFCIFFFCCDKNAIICYVQPRLVQTSKNGRVRFTKKHPLFLFQETSFRKSSKLISWARNDCFRKCPGSSIKSYTQVGGVCFPKFRSNCVIFRYKILKKKENSKTFFYINK